MQMTEGRELLAEGTTSAKALQQDYAWNGERKGRAVGSAVREVPVGQKEWGLKGHASTLRELKDPGRFCVMSDVVLVAF